VRKFIAWLGLVLLAAPAIAADTTTTNYGLVKPEIGASNDSWGTKTNSNWDIVDTQLKAALDAATAAMPKTGGTFTGGIVVDSLGINSNSNARGNVQIIAGDASHTGYVQLNAPDGTRQATIGYVPTNGAIEYHSDNATAGHYFTGGKLTVDNNSVYAENFFAGTQGGARGYSLVAPGNSNVSGYYGMYSPNGSLAGYIGQAVNGGLINYVSNSGAGHNFVGGDVVVNGGLRVTGNISAGGTIYPKSTDGVFYLNTDGGNYPYINFDAGDYLQYDRSANKFLFVIGGALVASIDASGTLRVRGNVIANTGP
jgi:hypothetical protein